MNGLIVAIVAGLIVVIGVLIFLYGRPEDLKQYITLLQQLETIMSIAAMVGNLLI